MKKYEIKHTITMEEVFEVSVADEDENNDETCTNGNDTTRKILQLGLLCLNPVDIGIF